MADVLRESKFQVQCVIGRTGNGKNIFVYDIMPAGEMVVPGGLAIDIGTVIVKNILLHGANISLNEWYLLPP